MKKIKTYLIGLAAIVALGIAGDAIMTANISAQGKSKGEAIKFAPVVSGVYNLDRAHSTVGFAVRHYEINWVEGRFNDFTGKVEIDEKDITKSTVEFSAKIDSIDTSVAGRDAHLKRADFFDAEKFPTLSFKSTSVMKKGKNLMIEGDFTMKGVTKKISFPFTMTGAYLDDRGTRHFGIEATTVINRRDYGINYGNALPIGGKAIGDDVTVRLRLEAAKSEAKK
jgi:polyisoprenoid-binding protein YceI